MKIHINVATRHSYDDFFSKSALGKTLNAYKSDCINIQIYCNNNNGLSRVYNHAIANTLSSDNDIYVFCHDDIYILDFYWIDVLVAALEKYDIVGLAGNTTRIDMQPSWLFSDVTFSKFNATGVSGIVAHGRDLPPQNLTIYGPPDQYVELLDGLFLATKSKTIKVNNLSFDEQFKFDFYDLDFCRSARSKGLTLGTMALSVMHESGGNFNTVQWNDGYQRYIQKWKS